MLEISLRWAELIIRVINMATDIPQELQELEANSGIFAIWMVFHHYGIDLEISDLVQLCRHDPDTGTSTIGLCVALQKLGLDVVFSTDFDTDLQDNEVHFYAEAKQLNIPIQPAISYSQIQHAVEQGQFAIVYYDTLEGVGNHSLIYGIDDEQIEFFDSFEAMPKSVFEQQRQVEGICRQAILIDDRAFVVRAQQ